MDGINDRIRAAGIDPWQREPRNSQAACEARLRRWLERCERREARLAETLAEAREIAERARKRVRVFERPEDPRIKSQ
jgi:hypothetical protein